MESADENVRKVFGVLEALSGTATTFLREQDASGDYPAGFFTMPDVEEHLGVARKISGALLTAYLPLVHGKDLSLWHQYSVENQGNKLNKRMLVRLLAMKRRSRLPYTCAQPTGWIKEANGIGPTPNPIPSEIWTHPPDERRRGLAQCSAPGRRLDGEPEQIIPVNAADGPFAPVWTFSPPPPPEDTTIINYDMFDKPVFKKAVDFIRYTRKPAFLDVCTQTKWFGESAPDGGDHPQTVVVYPVFADFEVDSEIVGHLVAVIPWNVFFDRTVSEGGPSSLDIVMVCCSRSVASLLLACSALTLKLLCRHARKIPAMKSSLTRLKDTIRYSLLRKTNITSSLMERN